MASSGQLATVFLLCLATFPLPSSSSSFYSSIFNRSSSSRHRGVFFLPGIELPRGLSFDSIAPSTREPGCGSEGEEEKPPPRPPLKLHLRHRPRSGAGAGGDISQVTSKDRSRIHAFRRRIAEGKNLDAASRLSRSRSLREVPPAPARIMATLESGVSQGSGEYFMDVFVGTPPRHFSLILDTGSDLNWIQCLPCHDCFEQSGPHYDPSLSSSYRNVSCTDPRCRLVSSPDPPQTCASADQSCPYYYWYGDRSNTTGDLAVEAFTVNLTATGEPVRIDGVLFGCGHWNRGLFHGAAGLLGMGRGPLSFPSQLRDLYGHTFSYCLVDRNSDASVSSKLLFGDDRAGLPEANYTTLVKIDDNPAETFYYVHVKGVMVGGKMLDIPADSWALAAGEGGGTIVDSGTTLSYFVEPAYESIKEEFRKQVGDRLPVVDDFPVLELCYNVSGIGKAEAKLPEFAIVFMDGAVWRFPEGNSFIRLEPEAVTCLAMLGVPRKSFNILGNYQQQNFHITYDTKKSRLGFAPTDCALL